jgi:hypothetical protein
MLILQVASPAVMMWPALPVVRLVRGTTALPEQCIQTLQYHLMVRDHFTVKMRQDQIQKDLRKGLLPIFCKQRL